MNRFIREIRKKPARTKEKLALVFTFVSSLFIFFFWISVVRYEILPSERLAKTRSPFAVIGDIFKTSYKNTIAGAGAFRGEEEKSSGEGKLIVVPYENISAKE